MSTDSRPAAGDPEATFSELLTYAELLNTPRLARLYSYVLTAGPVTVETIKTELEMAHSTAYKYVGQLEGPCLITRQRRIMSPE